MEYKIYFVCFINYGYGLGYDTSHIIYYLRWNKIVISSVNLLTIKIAFN